MSQPLRVLVVDDNPQDRRLVVRELRKSFPDVCILEAIDQAQLDRQVGDGNIDLVITDYHLKWSNGNLVLKAVKERLPHCPVIMFTGTGNEEIAVEAMKQGLDDYIIKNVKHLIRLNGAVQAVLGHAGTRRQVNQQTTRMESLLSQLQVGIFSCDAEGRFLHLNNAMLELLECESAVEARQKSLLSLFPDHSKAEKFLNVVVESVDPLETEIKVSDSADQSRIFRLNARTVHADDGPLRIDGLLEDITRRKQSESVAQQGAIAAAQISMLSPRESDVLQEVVAGFANKVIARRLEISEKTVEKHRSSLMKKLNVQSVAELVRLAMLAENVVG